MASPIRRLVQLVLDRNAAKKTEAGAKKSLGVVEKGLGRLKQAAIGLGAALGAAFVTRKIFQFGKAAVRTAAEADAIWNRLRGTVEGAGEDFDALQPSIVATARAMQDATTVGDEDFASTLQALVNISQDVAGSIENVGLVADLAAAQQIDLRTAALLVGRAMVGQTSLLSRYGIVVEEGADAVEVMREQFGGMAANEAKSLEGQVAQLNNEWADLLQAVGEVIVGATDGAGILGVLIETTKNLTEWVNRNKDSLIAVGQAFGWVAKVAGLVWDGWRRLALIGSGALLGTLGVLQEGAVRLNRAFAATLDVMADVVDRIPGLGAVADFLRDRAEEARADATRMDLEADAARKTAKALWDQATAQRAVNRARSEGPSIPEPPGGGSEEEEGGGGDPLSARIESLGAAAITAEDGLARLRKDSILPLDDALAGLEERNRLVQSGLMLTASNAKETGEVASTAGQVIGAALGSGIGALAEGKAKQNAIMAAEQLALGLVASLNPLTAPKAAGHFTAAGKFAGIATAWAGLAGATGGAGGVGGGSAGGVGAAGGTRDVGGRTSESVGAPGPELSVYFTGEGFDAINPKVQRVVQTALREAEANAGSNARVRTFRGNIPTSSGGA